MGGVGCGGDVCTARKGQSQPKIKRVDVRWNRNQWIKEDPDVAIGHADADKQEKNATGTILEPCRETTQLNRAVEAPAPAADTADTEPPKPTTKKTKTSKKKKTGTKRPAAPESDQPAAPESDQPAAPESDQPSTEEPVAPGKPRDIDPADIEF